MPQDLRLSGSDVLVLSVHNWKVGFARCGSFPIKTNLVMFWSRLMSWESKGTGPNATSSLDNKTLLRNYQHNINHGCRHHGILASPKPPVQLPLLG